MKDIIKVEEVNGMEIAKQFAESLAKRVESKNAVLLVITLF